MCGYPGDREVIVAYKIKLSGLEPAKFRLTQGRSRRFNGMSRELTQNILKEFQFSWWVVGGYKEF